MLDFNPWDPYERADFFRESATGERFDPAIGTDFTKWFINNANSSDFPVAEKSLIDVLLLRKKEYKQPQESSEEYLTRLVSSSSKYKDKEMLEIFRGQVCLEFTVLSYGMNKIPLNFSDGVRSEQRNHVYQLNYEGWTQNKKLPELKSEPVHTPDFIKFLDSNNRWVLSRSTFSDYYIKDRKFI